VSAERRLFDSSAAPGARRRGAGLAPGVVDDVQRGRIFEALLAAAEDREIGEIAVNHILQHAGMSARTFHAYFETREDCLRTATLRRYLPTAPDLTPPGPMSAPPHRRPRRAPGGPGKLHSETLLSVPKPADLQGFS
jgi:AcrR family transcriptional regulator